MAGDATDHLENVVPIMINFGFPVPGEQEKPDHLDHDDTNAQSKATPALTP